MESTMESTAVNTVWINPPKYWAATQNMTDEQKSELLDKVEQLVLAGDIPSLEKYDFVELNPATGHSAFAEQAEEEFS